MTPRILFVMGKGGVGRSTVAAALGLRFAAGGENTLIVEWTAAEPIAPWFGEPPAAHEGRTVAPRLTVMNYSLAETLREYFVGHLHAPLLYDTVIANRHVQRLIDAAPGIAELLFCGRLFWLTSQLARDEAGLDYQRIVVDAPATGHGASLFAIPRTLAAFDAGGLLALERQRVTQMFAEPAMTGAVVVTLAEELAIEETAELAPRLARDLGRPPLALFVNRSVARFFPGQWEPSELRPLFDELVRRKAREASLNGFPLDEALLAQDTPAPRDIVRAMAKELEAWA